MFSKIVLAALCSTAVSGAPVYPGPESNVDLPEPIKVIPGCVNLWAGK